MEFSKIIIEATEALDRMIKSDESTKTDKTFTQHLLKALKIREKERKKVDVTVLDADFDDVIEEELKMGETQN